ncbi:MAG: hypothetical protein GY858_06900, partial [Candidatus Omnitrophica bacterium]|nr:hypothetical protein [Candidatus Omnitrophota bacterium]
MMEPPFEKFSTTCGNSSIDFTELPLVDKSFTANFTEVVPCGLQLPMDVSNVVTMKFLLGESKLWIDPLQTALKLKFQGLNEDGTVLMEDKEIAIICGLLHMAFGKMQIWSAGRLIKTYHSYAYLAHPMMMLHYDRGYTDSVTGYSLAFSIDTDWANDISFVLNRGLDVRCGLTQRSKIISLMARPFIPPFETMKLIPSEGRWEFHCTMNPNDFCMLSGETVPIPGPKGEKPKQKLVPFKLRLLEAEMHITHVKLSDEVRGNLQYILRAARQITYPVIDDQLDNFALVEGQKEQEIPNTPLPV